FSLQYVANTTASYLCEKSYLDYESINSIVGSTYKDYFIPAITNISSSIEILRTTHSIEDTPFSDCTAYSSFTHLSSLLNTLVGSFDDISSGITTSLTFDISSDLYSSLPSKLNRSYQLLMKEFVSNNVHLSMTSDISEVRGSFEVSSTIDTPIDGMVVGGFIAGFDGVDENGTSGLGYDFDIVASLKVTDLDEGSSKVLFYGGGTGKSIDIAAFENDTTLVDTLTISESIIELSDVQVLSLNSDPLQPVGHAVYTSSSDISIDKKSFSQDVQIDHSQDSPKRAIFQSKHETYSELHDSVDVNPLDTSCSAPTQYLLNEACVTCPIGYGCDGEVTLSKCEPLTVDDSDESIHQFFRGDLLFMEHKVNDDSLNPIYSCPYSTAFSAFINSTVHTFEALDSYTHHIVSEHVISETLLEKVWDHTYLDSVFKNEITQMMNSSEEESDSQYSYTYVTDFGDVDDVNVHGYNVVRSHLVSLPSRWDIYVDFRFDTSEDFPEPQFQHRYVIFFHKSSIDTQIFSNWQCTLCTDVITVQSSSSATYYSSQGLVFTYTDDDEIDSSVSPVFDDSGSEFLIQSRKVVVDADYAMDSQSMATDVKAVSRVISLTLHFSHSERSMYFIENNRLIGSGFYSQDYSAPYEIGVGVVDATAALAFGQDISLFPGINNNTGKVIDSSLPSFSISDQQNQNVDHIYPVQHEIRIRDVYYDVVSNDLVYLMGLSSDLTNNILKLGNFSEEQEEKLIDTEYLSELSLPFLKSVYLNVRETVAVVTPSNLITSREWTDISLPDVNLSPNDMRIGDYLAWSLDDIRSAEKSISSTSTVALFIAADCSGSDDGCYISNMNIQGYDNDNILYPLSAESGDDNPLSCYGEEGELNTCSSVTTGVATSFISSNTTNSIHPSLVIGIPNDWEGISSFSIEFSSTSNSTSIHNVGIYACPLSAFTLGTAESPKSASLDHFFSPTDPVANPLPSSLKNLYSRYCQKLFHEQRRYVPYIHTPPAASSRTDPALSIYVSGMNPYSDSVNGTFDISSLYPTSFSGLFDQAELLKHDYAVCITPFISNDSASASNSGVSVCGCPSGMIRMTDPRSSSYGECITQIEKPTQPLVTLSASPLRTISGILYLKLGTTMMVNSLESEYSSNHYFVFEEIPYSTDGATLIPSDKRIFRYSNEYTQATGFTPLRSSKINVYSFYQSDTVASLSSSSSSISVNVVSMFATPSTSVVPGTLIEEIIPVSFGCSSGSYPQYTVISGLVINGEGTTGVDVLSNDDFLQRRNDKAEGLDVNLKYIFEAYQIPSSWPSLGVGSSGWVDYDSSNPPLISPPLSIAMKCTPEDDSVSEASSIRVVFYPGDLWEPEEEEEEEEPEEEEPTVISDFTELDWTFSSTMLVSSLCISIPIISVIVFLIVCIFRAIFRCCIRKSSIFDIDAPGQRENYQVIPVELEKSVSAQDLVSVVGKTPKSSVKQLSRSVSQAPISHLVTKYLDSLDCADPHPIGVPVSYMSDAFPFVWCDDLDERIEQHIPLRVALFVSDPLCVKHFRKKKAALSVQHIPFWARKHFDLLMNYVAKYGLHLRSVDIPEVIEDEEEEQEALHHIPKCHKCSTSLERAAYLCEACRRSDRPFLLCRKCANTCFQKQHLVCPIMQCSKCCSHHVCLYNLGAHQQQRPLRAIGNNVNEDSYWEKSPLSPTVCEFICKGCYKKLDKTSRVSFSETLACDVCRVLAAEVFCCSTGRKMCLACDRLCHNMVNRTSHKRTVIDCYGKHL
ncbi:hypothetical protein ADUPG1_012251, partial [Aduncisulcus paluster]